MKKKFAIYWDCGYGSYETEIIEAENQEAAEKAAYEAWRQAAEDNSDYGVKEAPEDAETSKYDRGHGLTFYDEDGEEVE
jgi:hypothetical protein